MDTYVYRFPNATFATATPLAILLPMSWGDLAANTDAWLATGLVKNICIAMKPQQTVVLPLYVRLYDALVESTQTPRIGGTAGTKYTGKVGLGAAWTAGRTWSHPSLGTVSTDVNLVNVNALPSDLSGLREVWSGQGNEFAAGPVGTGNPIRLKVDMVCNHGMVIVVENRSGVDITATATVPPFVLTAEIEPHANGRQRQRNSLLSMKGAASAAY